MVNWQILGFWVAEINSKFREKFDDLKYLKAEMIDVRSSFIADFP